MTILNNSRMSCIGIANQLDLTEKWLPRLKTRGCAPDILNFPPYTIEEMSSILRDRLQSVALLPVKNQNGRTNQSIQKFMKSLPLIQPQAIELCVRKIAGMGDLRKALNILGQAIDLVENEARKAHLLGVDSDIPQDKGNHRPSLNPLTRPNSPFLNRINTTDHKKDIEISNHSHEENEHDEYWEHWLPKISVSHILKIVQSCYGSPLVKKIRDLGIKMKSVLVSAYVLEIAFQTFLTDSLLKKSVGPTLTGLFDVYQSIFAEKTIITSSSKSKLNFNQNTLLNYPSILLPIEFKNNPNVKKIKGQLGLLTKMEFFDMVNMLEGQGFLRQNQFQGHSCQKTKSAVKRIELLVHYDTLKSGMNEPNQDSMVEPIHTKEQHTGLISILSSIEDCRKLKTF